MSSDSILSSAEIERRWVLAMEKTFPRPQQHMILNNTSPQQPISNIKFDTPCVFKVPQNLTQQNPEAYAPRYLGLGPYHHLRPYKMNSQKLAAIRNYLSPEKLQNIQLVVERLIALEPIIRESYDHQVLDLDIQTLAWILVIDGLYLLQFLEKKNPSKWEEENLAGDVLMLENQIPFFVLEEIQQCLQLCPDPISWRESVLENFLRDLSPLGWNGYAMWDMRYSGKGRDHLLKCLYHLNVYELFRPSGWAGPALQILSFLNDIPWDKIIDLFKKEGGDQQTPKIDIPSVSEMREALGIKFMATQRICQSRFVYDEEFKNLYLPVISIIGTSEVVLRNLVAYEEASSRPGSTLELAEYVDLMCGIIGSANDVKILKEENIIKSELGDEEISRIFNGISKSTRKTDEKYKSNVGRAIDDVNKRYKKLTIVKAKAFLKKLGYVSFKVWSVLISVGTIIFLVLKAYCSVFGCKSPAADQSVLFSYQ